MATKETTYDEAQIAEKLQALPGWYFEDGWIRRVYKTDGWPTTLMLVNAVGYVAEAADHHPDLSVTWGRITVKLATHSFCSSEPLDARASTCTRWPSVVSRASMSTSASSVAATSRGRADAVAAALAAELATTAKRPSRTSLAVTPSVMRSAMARAEASAASG